MTKLERATRKLGQTLLLFSQNSDTVDQTVLLSDLGFPDNVLNFFSLHNIKTLGDLMNCDVSIFGNKTTFIYKINNTLKKYFNKTHKKDCSDWRINLSIVLEELSKKDEGFLKEDIQFSLIDESRTIYLLKRMNIFKFEDFLNFKPVDFYGAPNVGKKTIVSLTTFLVISMNLKKEELSSSSEYAHKCYISMDEKILDELSKQSDDFLDSHFETSMMSVRLRNVLKDCNINTYRDLLNFGFHNFVSQPNVGKRTSRDLLTNISIAIKNKDSVGEHSVKISSFTKVVEIINKPQVFAFAPDYSKSIQIFEFVRTKLLKEIDNYTLRNFTKRQYDIFSRRYLAEPKETLESISESYKVTRERIRQISINLEKRIISTFASNLNCLENVEIANFYDDILFVGDDLVPLLISYLLKEEGILGDIFHKITSNIKHSASGETVALEDNTSVAKKDLSFYIKKLSNCRFMLHVNYLSYLKEYDDNFIKSLNSDGKYSVALGKYFSSLRNNREYFELLGQTSFGDIRCDCVVVVAGTYIILVDYYDSLQSMLNEVSLDREKNLDDFCRRNGFGHASICKGDLSLKTLLETRVASSTKNEIISFLKSNSGKFFHAVDYISKEFKVTKNKVIGMALKENLYFTFDPLSIWTERKPDSSSINKDNLLAINNLKLTEEEKDVLIAVVSLANLLKGTDKPIWFGSIRVYLSGFKGSYLYQQCKGMKGFGSIPNVHSSKLKLVLNKFVDLGLLSEGSNKNEKTFYKLNYELYNASSLYEKLGL